MRKLILALCLLASSVIHAQEEPKRPNAFDLVRDENGKIVLPTVSSEVPEEKYTAESVLTDHPMAPWFNVSSFAVVEAFGRPPRECSPKNIARAGGVVPPQCPDALNRKVFDLADRQWFITEPADWYSRAYYAAYAALQAKYKSAQKAFRTQRKGESYIQSLERRNAESDREKALRAAFPDTAPN